MIKHKDNYRVFAETELPDKIPHDFGVGLKFDDTDEDNKGGWKISVQDKLPRKVKLEITSFVGGYDYRAQHFYAKLKVYSLSWATYDKDGKHIGTASHGGCTPWKKSKEDEGFELAIERPVTQVEIETQKQRFKGYEEGSMINAFDKPSEAIAAGKKVFEEVFVGDWKLEIDNNGYTDEDVPKHRVRDFYDDED